VVSVLVESQARLETVWRVAYARDGFKQKIGGRMVNDVVSWFGGQSETARALGVSPQAVFQWLLDGKIPPKRAIQIERLTAGHFKAVEISECETQDRT
jgi:hypothetical protein